MRPFTIEQTWLSCIECGYRADLLDERKFRCPKCGGLYEVNHNFKNSSLSPKEQIEMFDRRTHSSNFVDCRSPMTYSGVWRFKEWIMPFLPNDYIVSIYEGNVPIIPAGKHLRQWMGVDLDLYIIMEGMTPTGSFKDFGGTVMMSIAKAAGIKNIACASTGDTSAMAAAYATAAGIECVVILPKGKVTAVQLAQPLVHGAKIITLPGTFDDCMNVMQDLVRDYGVYPANSLNPARIEGHQATVFQIAQYFGWQLPDWIAVPIGNGSNSSSIGKGLRLMQQFGFNRISKILGCQSEAANPLVLAWDKSVKNRRVLINAWRNNYHKIEVGETSATAARIGDPVSREKVMREIDHSHGAMRVASEYDLNEAVAEVGKDGHFVCPQTGIALAGVRNAARFGVIKKGSRVVVVSTATGFKFTETAVAHLQDNIMSANDCKTETVAKIMGL